MPAENGSVSYGYDAVGNRLSRTSTLGAVPSTANTFDDNDRLTSDSYDNNGNTITANSNAYGYDFENRLSSLNGGVVSFVYDGDGNRVAKTVNGVTTRFLVDSNNPTGYAQVVDEISANQVTRTYTYGHSLITQRQLVNSQWQVSFYGYDGLGCVRLLTDFSGAITDTYTYDAFGNLIAATGNTPNEHLYSGEQYDANVGFYYLRARYMNPSSGRFQMMDPFAGMKFEPRTLHKYTYAENDPVNKRDPSGQMSIAELSGVQVTWGVLTAMAVLSIATVCYFQFALGETANYYGADLSNVQSPCVRQRQPTRVFYRGTTFYDALEAVEAQHIDRRDANRKQKFHHKTIHGTKRDAERYLFAVRREMDLGVFVEPAVMSVSDYVSRWLRDAVRPRVSARTADGYDALLKRYVISPLGHKRLDRIQPLDIQEVYGAMQARGLSATVVRHTHSALHNALKQAVKWGLLSRNPSDFVELPKVAHKERRVLSPGEAIRFLKAADTKPNGLIFELALLTGMRPEEYLALQWSDIDFKRGTAQIQRALVRHKKSVSFEEPKTARSRRTVYLSEQLMKKLATHKRKQAVKKLKFNGTWGPFDLVFCSVEGTPLSIPNLTYRYFRPILTAAKLPQIRLYDLRHTCATLLLIAEENPKVVSERLGHSTIVLTLDTYSHVLPTMQQGATNRLEKLLYSKRNARSSDTPVTQTKTGS